MRKFITVNPDFSIVADPTWITAAGLTQQDDQRGFALTSFEERIHIFLSPMQSQQTSWAIVYNSIDCPIKVASGMSNSDHVQLDEILNWKLNELLKHWLPQFLPPWG